MGNAVDAPQNKHDVRDNNEQQSNKQQGNPLAAEAAHDLSNPASKKSNTAVLDKHATEDGKLKMDSAFRSNHEQAHKKDAFKSNDQSEKLKHGDKGDAGDIPLNRETQEAKDKALDQLRDRFKDDPAKMAKIEQLSHKMDQRVLHQHIETEGNREKIDPQQQLKQGYENLSKLASGEAEKRTYTDSKGREQHYFSKTDVNNAITDGLNRAADPNHRFDQGHHNTCAAERIQATMARDDVGGYMGMLADAGTKGSVDINGKHVQLDQKSLRADKDARSTDGMTRQNVRGLAGQWGDIAVAQYNLDQASGESGRYVYKQDLNPSGQSQTGEHVIDTKHGREVAQNPLLNAERISNTLQGMVGDKISDDFGKKMTLTGHSFGDKANVTRINNDQQLVSELKDRNAKDWGAPVLASHTGNYMAAALGQGGSGGDAGGWHATGVELAADGEHLNMLNNWGGKGDFNNVDAKTMLGWMETPQVGMGDQGVGGGGRDHIIGPDKVYGDNDPLSDKKVVHKDHEHDHDKKDKDKDKLAKTEHVDEIFRKLTDESAKLQEVINKLASMPENDPERPRYLAEQAEVQYKVAKMRHLLS